MMLSLIVCSLSLSMAVADTIQFYRNQCVGGDWVVCQCNETDEAVGGGCFAKDPPYQMQKNGPRFNHSWECGGHGGAKKVWVICAQRMTGGSQGNQVHRAHQVHRAYPG